MSKTSFAEVDIQSAVFVTREGVAADYQVRPAVTGQRPAGISGDYSRDAPIPQVSAADLELQAKAGEPVAVLDALGDPENRTMLLRITEPVVRGALLMPDATTNGSAINHANGNWYGAEAIESGAAGELIRVMPIVGYR